jgi:hypothetical protein
MHVDVQISILAPLPQSFDCVSKNPGEGSVTKMEDFPELFKQQLA